eukprot:TRINITY_DN230_c1_g3_i1.p1 TRINITY_DN230_c1_g3~~TRINITY_DN230_c1_g3_i1.p1  ORF type:complete len:956 (+),score=244.99 TRINITY_DN230_c1_g3_i1:105-2972(+)
MRPAAVLLALAGAGACGRELQLKLLSPPTASSSCINTQGWTLHFTANGDIPSRQIEVVDAQAEGTHREKIVVHVKPASATSTAHATGFEAVWQAEKMKFITAVTHNNAQHDLLVQIHSEHFALFYPDRQELEIDFDAPDVFGNGTTCPGCRYNFTIEPEVPRFDGARDFDVSMGRSSLVMATVSLFLPTGNFGATLGMVGLASRAMACPAPIQYLPRALNPLGLALGTEGDVSDDPGHQGAVIGVIILLAIPAVFRGLLAWSHRRSLSARGYRAGGKADRHDKDEFAYSTLFFSRCGIMYHYLCFVYFSAAVGTFHVAYHSTRAAYRLTGGVVLIAFVGGALYHTLRVVNSCGQNTEFDVRPSHGWSKTSTGLGARMLWGRDAWISRENHRNAALWFAVYRQVFVPFKPRYRWFLTAQLAQICVMAALAVWQPVALYECRWRAIVMGTVMIVRALFVVACRPYTAAYANLIEAFASVSMVVMTFSIVLALEAPNPSKHWGATTGTLWQWVSLWAIGIKFLFDTAVLTVHERAFWRAAGETVGTAEDAVMASNLAFAKFMVFGKDAVDFMAYFSRPDRNLEDEQLVTTNTAREFTLHDSSTGGEPMTDTAPSLVSRPSTGVPGPSPARELPPVDSKDSKDASTPHALPAPMPRRQRRTAAAAAKPPIRLTLPPDSSPHETEDELAPSPASPSSCRARRNLPRLSLGGPALLSPDTDNAPTLQQPDAEGVRDAAISPGARGKVVISPDDFDPPEALRRRGGSGALDGSVVPGLRRPKSANYPLRKPSYVNEPPPDVTLTLITPRESDPFRSVSASTPSGSSRMNRAKMFVAAAQANEEGGQVVTTPVPDPLLSPRGSRRRVSRREAFPVDDTTDGDCTTGESSSSPSHSTPFGSPSYSNPALKRRVTILRPLPSPALRESTPPSSSATRRMQGSRLSLPPRARAKPQERELSGGRAG